MIAVNLIDPTVDKGIRLCYNTHMKNATVNNAHMMNEFEVLQVSDWMEKTKPNVYYTMTPGNDCIWVYYSYVNLYFIFRDGKIADVQID